MKLFAILTFFGFIINKNDSLSKRICFKVSGYEDTFFSFSADETIYPLPTEMVALVRVEKRSRVRDTLITQKTMRYQLFRESCKKKFTFEGFSNNKIYTIFQVDITLGVATDYIQKYIFEARSTPKPFEMTLEDIYGTATLHADYLPSLETIWDVVAPPFNLRNIPILVPQPYSMCLRIQYKKLNMLFSLGKLSALQAFIFEKTSFLKFSLQTNINGNIKMNNITYSAWTYPCNRKNQLKIHFVTSDIVPGSKLFIEFYDQFNKFINSSSFTLSSVNSTLAQNKFPQGLVIKAKLLSIRDVKVKFEHKYIYVDKLSMRPMQCTLLGDNIVHNYVARQLGKTKFRLTFSHSDDLRVPGMIAWRSLYKNEEWDELVFGSTLCNWREKNLTEWLNP